jgi:hypothetical protein
VLVPCHPRSSLVPSPFFCTHESSVQVPTSCSFNDCYWPSASNVIMDDPKTAIVHAAKITRKFIGLFRRED